MTSTGGCWRCNARGVECVLQKASKGTVCMACVKAHVLCTMAGDNGEVKVEDGKPQKKKTQVEVETTKLTQEVAVKLEQGRDLRQWHSMAN